MEDRTGSATACVETSERYFFVCEADSGVCSDRGRASSFETLSQQRLAAGAVQQKQKAGQLLFICHVPPSKKAEYFPRIADQIACLLDLMVAFFFLQVLLSKLVCFP